jgi:hypothetical protein
VFSFTDFLRGDRVLSKEGELSREYVAEVLRKLSEWHKDNARFLLTKSSLRAYRALRAALSAHPDNGHAYSQAQRQPMFECKNVFRSALRYDLMLL